MKKLLILLVIVGVLMSAGGCKPHNYRKSGDTAYRAESVQIFFTIHPEFGLLSDIQTVPVNCYQNYQFRVRTNTNRYFLIYLKRDGRIVGVREITKAGRKNWL